MWRFGSGDWLEVFRVYNGLGPDLRPVGRPDGLVHRPARPLAYRHFLYALAKHAAKIEEGLQEAKASNIRALKGRGSATSTTR